MAEDVYPEECPECGSTDIDMSSSLKYEWECQECGHQFDVDEGDLEEAEEE